MRMPWGKHVDEELEDIPPDYLEWVLENCDELRPQLQRAIEECLGLVEQQQAPGRGLAGGGVIREEDLPGWLSKLAKRWHPDNGGTKESMQAINMAYDELRKLLKK